MMNDTTWTSQTKQTDAANASLLHAAATDSRQRLSLGAGRVLPTSPPAITPELSTPATLSPDPSVRP